MRARPVSPAGLACAVADRIATAHPAGHVRVAVDGAAPTRTRALADAVADLLLGSGRAAHVVPADGFLRPASQRFEHGRADPDAFYEDRLDLGALDREVLTPLGPGGSGRFLPSRWDALRDRATRADYLQARPGLVLLVPGELLLGRWLEFELTVHLAMSAAALRRRTDAGAAWTLPAYERYVREVDPVGSAHVVALVDDPQHPALVLEP